MGKRLASVIAATICLVSLISGCTVHLVPSKIPPLDTGSEDLAGPFDNITASLVNDQADDTEFSVKDLNGKDTGWVLSRKLWTEKLVEALEAELTARQAKIIGGAPGKISLKITEVVYTRTAAWVAVLQFRVTASITSNSGWTKIYVADGSASAWVPAGMKEDSNWNRAANWAIRNLVLAIMSDSEFIGELGKKK